MTTNQGEMVTQTTTGEKAVTSSSSSSSGAEVYFAHSVVVMGVIGTAINVFVLYALVASRNTS